MKFGGPLAIIVHYTIQFNLECYKSSVLDMDPNTILKIKEYISNAIFKVKFKKSQHTILMKFGGPLAIIVHYTVQFYLECCISSVPDMGPNTILKIIKYIPNDILKVKFKKIPTYNHYEIVWTTCYHSPLHDTI